MIPVPKLEEAIARVKRGDQAAFRQVVEHTVATLTAYVRFHLADPDVVDDVLQETFVLIYRNIDRYEANTNFMAWAKAIARNQALAERKRQQRKRSAKRRYVEELTARLGDAVVRMDVATPLEEQLSALKACLSRLSEKMRTLITYRYFDGLSLEQTAIRTGMKPSAAGMALHRTRIALSKCMSGLP